MTHFWLIPALPTLLMVPYAAFIAIFSNWIEVDGVPGAIDCGSTLLAHGPVSNLCTPEALAPHVHFAWILIGMAALLLITTLTVFSRDRTQARKRRPIQNQAETGSPALSAGRRGTVS